MHTLNQYSWSVARATPRKMGWKKIIQNAVELNCTMGPTGVYWTHKYENNTYVSKQIFQNYPKISIWVYHTHCSKN